MDTDARPVGTSWPDVAIEVVKFAREEPLTFIPVFAVVIFGLWFLFPRVTSAMRARYQGTLDKWRRSDSGKETSDD